MPTAASGARVWLLALVLLFLLSPPAEPFTLPAQASPWPSPPSPSLLTVGVAAPPRPSSGSDDRFGPFDPLPGLGRLRKRGRAWEERLDGGAESVQRQPPRVRDRRRSYRRQNSRQQATVHGQPRSQLAANKLAQAALAAARAGQADQAVSEFLEAADADHGHSVEVRLGNQVIDALGKTGHLAAAFRVYECMQAHPSLAPTVVTYGTLVGKAASTRRLDLAERVWADMRAASVAPDVPVTNAMINAFAKAGSPDRALAALAQMPADGLRPNAITWNTVIDAVGRAGDLRKAEALLEEMQQAGCRPNERTFSNLIHACARQGEVDRAFAWFTRLEQEPDVEPNAVIYSTLIDACGRAAELPRAFATLRQMKQAGFRPNVITWTSLIDACVKQATRRTRTTDALAAGGDGGAGRGGGTAGGGDTATLHQSHLLKLALRLFQEMLSTGERPNKVTCTALMDGCLKCGQLDAASEVFMYMRQAKLEPSRVTFTSLLHECTRAGRADFAADLLRTLDDSLSTGDGALNVSAVLAGGGGGSGDSGGSQAPSTEDASPKSLADLLLHLFSETSRVEDAFFVLRRMLDENQAPDEAALQAIFGAIDTKHRLDEALDLIDRMRSRGDRVNEMTFAALLAACGRMSRLVPALDLVEQLKQSGALDQGHDQGHDEQGPSVVYSALVEACTSAADGTAALRVFEDMSRAGVQPGVREYTNLLSALSAENALQAKQHRRERSNSSPPAAPKGQLLGLGRFLRDVGVVEVPPPAEPQPPLDMKHQAVPPTFEPTSATPPPPPLPAAAASPAAASATTAAAAGGQCVEAVSAAAAAEAAGDVECNRAAVALKGRGGADSTSTAPHSTAAATTLATSAVTDVEQAGLYRVFLVFRDMRTRGLEPDCAAFNALLSACARAGDLDRGLQVLREMVEEDIQPDVITYTSLIKACGKTRKVDMAEEFFRIMLQRTNHFASLVLPTEQTFAELMRANLSAGRPARALALFGELQRRHKLQPTLLTFQLALIACDRIDDWQRAVKVYEAMLAEHVRLDNKSLLALVSVLNRGGRDDLAAAVRQQRSTL